MGKPIGVADYLLIVESGFGSFKKNDYLCTR